MNKAIELDNVVFRYAETNILKNLSFSVARGTFLVIAGPNGAGKTTLINLLCRLLHPQYGSIRIEGSDINSYQTRELARKVAVVRQGSLPAFRFTVTDIVLMGRTAYLNTFGFENESDRRLVSEALDLTDTARFASRPVLELSGGERQRVLIARALAQDTPILLLDEPTSFLDLKHRVGIYDLLKRLQREKAKTIVVVSHDINLAAQYCEHVLLLAGPQGCGSYQVGNVKEVFSAAQVEAVFGVKIFTGRVGQEKFFLPLGKFAKDAASVRGDSAAG